MMSEDKEEKRPTDLNSLVLIGQAN